MESIIPNALMKWNSAFATLLLHVCHLIIIFVIS